MAEYTDGCRTVAQMALEHALVVELANESCWCHPTIVERCHPCRAREALAVEVPELIGYRCRKFPVGVIPLASFIDPCGQDDEVWSDGHVGPRRTTS